MKDPDKVIPPTGNLVLINLGAENSEDHVPFTLLDDIPLDLGHGAVIEASVIGSLSIHIGGMAHVVSCPTAPRTDWVS